MFDDDDDEVGYGRPPKQFRFRTGVSGNPSGRPKGKLNGNISAILEKEIFRSIQIKRNGNVSKMPAIQAVVLQIMQSALKGNQSAVKAVLLFLRATENIKANEPKEKPIDMTRDEIANRITVLLATAKRRREHEIKKKTEKKTRSDKPTPKR